eukprot:g15336.t1
MDVPWPDSLNAVFSIQGVISTIGEHLLSPDCELQGTRASDLIYFKQIAYVSSPFILALTSYVFWRLVSKYQGRLFTYRGPDDRSPSLLDGSVATVVFLLYLMYPTLCRGAFALIMCIEVDGKRYLLADLQEPCYEGRHLNWFLFLTIPQILLYVIGLPAYGFFLVRRYARIGRLKHQIVEFRYGMLYSGYRYDRWYWDTVVAFRKAMVALITSCDTTHLNPLKFRKTFVMQQNIVNPLQEAFKSLRRKSERMDTTTIEKVLPNKMEGGEFRASSVRGRRKKRAKTKNRSRSKKEKAQEIEMINNPLSLRKTGDDIDGAEQLPLHRGRARAKTESSMIESLMDGNNKKAIRFNDVVLRGKKIKMLRERMKSKEGGNSVDNDVRVNIGNNEYFTVIEKNSNVSVLSFGGGWNLIVSKDRVDITPFNEENGKILDGDGGGRNDGELEDEWKMKYDIVNRQFYYYHVGSNQTQWQRPIKGETFDKLL